MPEAIDLRAKLALFSDHWSPRLVGHYNGNEVRLAKAKGEFQWHSHGETDELFLVIEGQLAIEFRDRTEHIGTGQMIVVPRGTEHRPYVPEGEVHMLIIDADGTPNTGNAETAAKITAI